MGHEHSLGRPRCPSLTKGWHRRTRPISCLCEGQLCFLCPAHTSAGPLINNRLGRHQWNLGLSQTLLLMPSSIYNVCCLECIGMSERSFAQDYDLRLEVNTTDDVLIMRLMHRTQTTWVRSGLRLVAVADGGANAMYGSAQRVLIRRGPTGPAHIHS